MLATLKVNEQFAFFPLQDYTRAISRRYRARIGRERSRNLFKDIQRKTPVIFLGEIDCGKKNSMERASLSRFGYEYL